VHVVADSKQVHELNPRARFGQRSSPKQGNASSMLVEGCPYPDGCLPLVYSQGPVLSTPVIYVMFYGTWNTTEASFIQNFYQDLSGNAPLNLISFYPFNPSTGNLVWGGSVIRNTPGYNRFLNDTDVSTLVANEPTWAVKNPNGIYFILSSPDVTATSGFCNTYCGFHSVISGTRYAWVGNAATQCPIACTASQPGPNPGYVGLDGMTSVIWHELAEVITDGYFNGYRSTDLRETGFEEIDWFFLLLLSS